MPLTKRTACRLCGGTQLNQAIKLNPTPCANSFRREEEVGTPQPHYPLTVYFCDDCKHLQLLDIVSPEELFSDYVYVTGTSPVFIKHFEEYASHVLDILNPAPDSLILDIGSNDGTFLSFFRKRGHRVLGIDPAKRIAESASADGIPTLAKFFNQRVAEEIVQQHGPASIATANNVFAHIDDLKGTARAIRTVIGDGGVFVFEVSYLLDVYEGCLFDTIYHEHLDYHSVQPLISFFESQGMALFKVERVQTHGGSIRGFVCRSGPGARRVDQSVENLAAEERDKGIDKLDTFHRFEETIRQHGKELKKTLYALRDSGKSIAGFGAPAKVTTLMHEFGLDSRVIDFIVDDSKLKQGLFTPGLNLPVLPTSEIYGRKPDVVVIFAWNFADSIIRNHRAFIDAGGTFIVPLPTLRTVSC